jgi:hypothetical protein
MIVKTAVRRPYYSLGEKIMANCSYDIPLYFAGYQDAVPANAAASKFFCYVYVRPFQLLQIMAEQKDAHIEIMAEDDQ